MTVDPGSPRDLAPVVGSLSTVTPPPLDPSPERVLAFIDDGIPESLREGVPAHLARWFPSAEVSSEIVAGGESLKSIAGWSTLLEHCRTAGLDRSSLLVAVGGGAVGDAVGFTASTWHRGIRWLAVPTTLLAMVDAHLGGKTALDLGALKNPVGTFWWPEAIIADPAFLESLTERERRSGWAEMLKAAWIDEAELFARWEAEPPIEEKELDAKGRPRLRLPTAEEIARTVAVKARVVRADPREGDRRRVLNLGHTLGHALETLEGGDPHDDPRGLAHGEAVATGMAFAAALARGRPGAGDEPLRLVRLLERLGYRTTWPTDRTEELLSRIASDKKTRAGRTVFALPTAVGQVDLVPVATEELRGPLGRGEVGDRPDSTAEPSTV